MSKSGSRAHTLTKVQCWSVFVSFALRSSTWQCQCRGTGSFCSVLGGSRCKTTLPRCIQPDSFHLTWTVVTFHSGVLSAPAGIYVIAGLPKVKLFGVLPWSHSQSINSFIFVPPPPANHVVLIKNLRVPHLMLAAGNS